MLELLLVSVAPVLQIVLSVFRILHRISLPLAAIAVLCCLVGLAASAILMNISAPGMHENPHPKNCIDCGAIYVYGGLLNFFATFVFTGLIALIARIFYTKPVQTNKRV